MVRRIVAAVALALVLPVTAAPGALAQSGPDDLQECLEGVNAFEDGVPTCTYQDGKLVRRDFPGQIEVETRGLGSLFAMLFVFALIWSVIPPIAAYQIAKNNGQSTGVAILLGLLLGWVGLLIVYLMGRSDTRYAAHHVIEELGPRPPRPPQPPYPPAPPAPPAPPGGTDVAARLTRLDRLRTDGVVTDEEYAAKRAAIIDAL